MKKMTGVLLCVVSVSACTQSQYDRLKMVGKEPEMKNVDIPIEKSAPVVWPTARAQVAEVRTVNSLWRKDAKSFFGDMRARSVGDILKVMIKVSDKAELDNKTERKRSNSENLGVPSLYGLQGKLTKFLPGDQNPASLLDITSDTDSSGEGIIEREEVVETEVAAVVTQLLPNGNLVVYGSQEVRVNFEVRQITVQGVVKPSDVSPDNSVDLSRMAEARVSYGGKGLITDVQQPRVGNQIVDILSPW